MGITQISNLHNKEVGKLHLPKDNAWGFAFRGELGEETPSIPPQEFDLQRWEEEVELGD